jgi:S-adenosyl methyltransferase
MHKALHVPEGLDITRPSPARIYDYMLGGGQYFGSDAQAAERILDAVPEIRDSAWANRGYHQRVAAWIARQGVRQFPDLGCGLPAAGDTRDVMFVSDESDPWDLVSRYVRAMGPGSYLSLTHATDDAKPPAAVEALRRVFETATEHLYFRSRPEVARFFDGLEIVPPYPGPRPGLAYGEVRGAEDPDLADSDGSRWLYGAVARIS